MSDNKYYVNQYKKMAWTINLKVKDLKMGLSYEKGYFGE